MKQGIASLLTGIGKSFPFKIVFYTQANMKERGDFFPGACSVFQQVSNRGIPCLLSVPGDVCELSLPCRGACMLDAVYFYPVYDGSSWLGTLCAWPVGPGEHHTFFEQKDQLEPLFSLISSYIISSEKEERLIRENGILKQEMRNMMGLAREMWLIINQQGQVMEVSQQFCSLTGLRRSKLIGEDVTVILANEDWDRLSQIPEHGSS